MEQLQVGALADQLGLIEAQRAELEKSSDALKEEIKRRAELHFKKNGGKPVAIEGSLFRATVSKGERVTLIAEKVRAFLKPQQLRHAEQVTPFVAVRVVSKNGNTVSNS